jgi:hypothetical protein
VVEKIDKCLKIYRFGTNHPDWASPSKFDFVRIFATERRSPLLQKEGKFHRILILTGKLFKIKTLPLLNE